LLGAVKISAPARRFAASEAEVLQAYQRYLEAFLADDIAAIDALVQYPLAYIG
jgi:hypothetical protein